MYQDTNKYMCQSTRCGESVATSLLGNMTHNTNIELQGVLNARDISTACKIIVPGKVFRAGCVSNASEADVELRLNILIITN